MRIAERLDLVTGLNVAKKDPASVLRPYDTFESEMFQVRMKFALLQLPEEGPVNRHRPSCLRGDRACSKR